MTVTELIELLSVYEQDRVLEVVKVDGHEDTVSRVCGASVDEFDLGNGVQLYMVIE